ncbi:hypothetical protein LAZ67_3001171 [Cordylochernes scorpioides]|uniref:F-BAR domain only protein 1 n=1 Tax=Cordylochernes scorpioides TaxID=51811 RepID=A0ABY6K897_9ARAC|nr:hypothetical protein LAZ67_3001171 [Cordylochernes scorpioides]
MSGASNIEDTHSKLLAKLSKHANNCCSQGTFAPLWQILKVSSEKLSTLHTQMVQRFQELIKDVNKYYEEQHRKHKQVKEEEVTTQEAVQTIQHTTASLHKAKENYTSKFVECEKLKRDNGSPKDIEKAENKCKKACEEYKNYLEKYETVRSDFESKMSRSCEHYQRIEEDHLTQMKEFLSSYSHILESGHSLIEQVYRDFRHQCNEMDVEALLLHLVTAKATGAQRPGPLEFEEVDVSSLASSLPAPAAEDDSKAGKKEGNHRLTSLRHKSKPSRHRSTSLLDLFFPPSTQKSTTGHDNHGFLKSKRERKKKENKKKSRSGTKEAEKMSGSPEENKKPTDQVCDKDSSFDKLKCASHHGFKLMVLTDEEDSREQKIHIQIKPLTNGAPMSASVDELRATIGTITLSPLTHHHNRRCATANSTASTPEDGPQPRRTTTQSRRYVLLCLELYHTSRMTRATPAVSHTLSYLCMSCSPSASSASTPTGVQSPTSIGGGQVTPVDRYAELSELFSESKPPAESCKLPVTNGSRGGTPTAFLGTTMPLLPRPTSQRTLEYREPFFFLLYKSTHHCVQTARGRVSPLIAAGGMTRTESLGSLTSTDFKATSMPVGSSRGPSPLTIGISDTIPLAVAFQEVVHAYFRGTEESRCQVRLVGDMKMSFPAGIVQILAHNPSPAPLCFRLSHTSSLERVLPNLQLLQPRENSTVGAEQQLFDFNMPALTSLLRKQHEKSPTASYFNIDILKYQVRAQLGAKSTPLHLVAYWKCEPGITDLRVDYKHNGAALTGGSATLTGLTVSVPVDGEVVDLQAKPTASWSAETQRLTWRIPELSEGLGSLRARLELAKGPSTPAPLGAQFLAPGTSLSGAEFELVGPGYRLSLLKKQVISVHAIQAMIIMQFDFCPYKCARDPFGKYICEPEGGCSS